MASNIIYVTRDRERAEGMPESAMYSIISGDGSQDTHEILADQEKLNGGIVVFKNTLQIEKIAEEKGFELLNPSAELAEKIENKITQVAWLGELGELLPPHTISLVKNISWNTKPFILQWAHSHTGEGTLLINNEKTLQDLQEKFPEREARVTDFIQGPMFTLNTIVTDTDILLGNISYQITGMLPFTENPFSTVGNDWSLPHTLLTEAHLQTIESSAKKIGEKMQKENWRGLFGIDVIYNEERDHIYLIEINARQPASTTYESQLQQKVRDHGVPGITTFEAHLAALTHTPITLPIVPINDGAQIVQRVTTRVQKAPIIIHPNYHTITYTNTKLNADLLRIQSERGIMETHNKLNTRGKEVLELVTQA